MPEIRRRGPSLRGPLLMWGIWAVVCLATWATNTRTPVSRLFAVSHSGFAAAAGRVLVLLGWPIGFAAIGLLAFTVERLLAADPGPRERAAVVVSAVAVVVLCSTAALPGVTDQNHLDAKAVNVPAAIGTVLALALTIVAVRRAPEDPPPKRSRRDGLLLVALVVLLFASIPWILANLGVYTGDVPGIRSIFMSKQIVAEPHHPDLRAVHLGNHDGFDGLLLAVTAAVAIRHLPQLRRLRAIATAYLSVLLVYGLAVATADFWTEQVVKRGWITERIPGVTRPGPNLAWAVILTAALAVTLAIRRRDVRRAIPVELSERAGSRARTP